MSRRTCLFVSVLLIAAVTYFIPGCDELITEQQVIIEAGHPIASFTASPRSCCAPCTVHFVDSSRGPRQVWIWNYGDTTSGDTFVGTNPDTVDHVYTTGGIYDVSLTVFDTTIPDTGRDTRIRARYVVIGTVSAAFTVTPDSACPGTEVIFEPPQGTIFRWVWDFGDSGTATFNNTTPDTVTHTYDSVGNYWAKLTVTDSCGSRTDSQEVVIAECPVAQFASVIITPSDTLPVSEGCKPLTVEFKDESVFPPDQTTPTYKWDFGNGENSNAQDATVRYDDTGTFVITLNVSSGGPWATATDTIMVFDSTTADFTADPTSSCVWPGRQFQVKFRSTTTGRIDSLFWAFGDGFYDSTGNVEPIHAYTQTGVHSCTLTTFGTCGIDTMIDTVAQDSLVIYADDFTTVGFSKTPDSAQVDSAFTFVDTSTGIILSRLWIIDPQTVDSVVVNDSVQFTHTYTDTADTGWHVISLTIGNGCDSAEVTDSVKLIVIP